MKRCGEVTPETYIAPSGRHYYVAGIHQIPKDSNSAKNEWFCTIRYTDGEKEAKDVPYNKVFDK